MEESRILEKIRDMKFQPSQNWSSKTHEYIKQLDNGVTIGDDNRNRLSSVSKFNKLFQMSPKVKLITTILTIVATLSAGGGAVYASDASNPGDFLYPLDKTVEDVQRIFVANPVQLAELEVAIMDERVSELESLVEKDNPELITLATQEIEAQQLKLENTYREMNQLRLENKVSSEEQLKAMEKLQTSLQNNEAKMTQIKSALQSSGENAEKNGEAVGNMEKIQNSMDGNLQEQLNKFETETGLKIETAESEQNQGEDTQIQNQNQNEVGGNDTQNGGDGGNQDTDNGSQNSDNTNQQNGGKN